MNRTVLNAALGRVRNLLRDPRRIPGRLRRRIVNRTLAALGGLSGYRAGAPEGIDLNLTDVCNLRCQMCDLWNPAIAGERDIQAMRKAELPASDWRRLVRQAGRAGSALNLIGGEVLMYPGFDEVLEEARGCGLRTLLITNGTLLDRHLDTLSRRPLDGLVVSIDGLSATHDTIRSMQGAFTKITDNLRRFHDRSPQTPIHLHTVISKLNVTELKAVADHFEREGWASSLKFIHLLSIDPASHARQKAFLETEFGLKTDYWKGAGVDDLLPDPAEVLGQFEAVSRTRYRMRILTFPELSPAALKRYYTDKTAFYRDHFAGRCPFLYSGLAVKSNGDAVLCPDVVVGSIRNSSLSEIINSPMARQLRKAYRKRGSFPACPACCFGYIGKAV